MPTIEEIREEKEINAIVENDNDDLEELEEIYQTSEELLEEILNNLAPISYYERKNVEKSIKMLISYSNEPGIKIEDLREMLNNVYENL